MPGRVDTKDAERFRWLIRNYESIGLASGDREPDEWVETSKLADLIDKAIAAKEKRDERL